MTYGTMQNITSGLLIGDNVLPDGEVLDSLVSYALTTVAMKASSLHLMTLDAEADILRLAYGEYFIRRPNNPEDLVDALDIEDELGFAVCRYLASYVSREKGGIHIKAADRIILDYNAKTYDMLETYKLELENDEDYDAEKCINSYSTEFNAGESL